MAGLIFIKTKNLDKTVEFYKNTLEMKTWVVQENIEILEHENLLLGFQHADVHNKDFLITFFFQSKNEVDQMYSKLKDRATSEPVVNEKYQIYNFFAKDIDDRNIEIQCFLHKLNKVSVNWI